MDELWAEHLQKPPSKQDARSILSGQRNLNLNPHTMYVCVCVCVCVSFPPHQPHPTPQERTHARPTHKSVRLCNNAEEVGRGGKSDGSAKRHGARISKYIQVARGGQEQHGIARLLQTQHTAHVGVEARKHNLAVPRVLENDIQRLVHKLVHFPRLQLVGNLVFLQWILDLNVETK